MMKTGPLRCSYTSTSSECEWRLWLKPEHLLVGFQSLPLYGGGHVSSVRSSLVRSSRCYLLDPRLRRGAPASGRLGLGWRRRRRRGGAVQTKMRPAGTAATGRIAFAARRRWRTVSSFPEATRPRPRSRSHLRDVPSCVSSSPRGWLLGARGTWSRCVSRLDAGGGHRRGAARLRMKALLRTSSSGSSSSIAF